jgi:hypothetical protein
MTFGSHLCDRDSIASAIWSQPLAPTMFNATEEEEEFIRVQQEIKRLHQEQESIMRRLAVAQHGEARRQDLNRERAKLVELQYNIDILR